MWAIHPSARKFHLHSQTRRLQCRLFSGGIFLHCADKRRIFSASCSCVVIWVIFGVVDVAGFWQIVAFMEISALPHQNRSIGVVVSAVGQHGRRPTSPASLADADKASKPLAVALRRWCPTQHGQSIDARYRVETIAIEFNADSWCIIRFNAKASGSSNTVALIVTGFVTCERLVCTSDRHANNWKLKNLKNQQPTRQYCRNTPFQRS